MSTLSNSPLIVIGAGAAGLAAAAALRDAGYPPLLLEARCRIGGRVWTDTQRGVVELGAEFIHGDQAATWAIVQAAGLATQRASEVREIALGGIRYPADDPLTLRVEQLYDRLCDPVEHAHAPEYSAAAWMRRIAPDDPAGELALRLAANIEAADVERLSAVAVARERAAWRAGTGNFHVLAGYSRVMAALATGLDIRLNSPVRQIVWRPGSATVQLDDPAQTTLTARAVIVTVPLGVLQAGALSFTPDLPPATTQALHALAMGHVSKLVLWFERVGWDLPGFISTDGVISTWWHEPAADPPALMGYTGGVAGLHLAQIGEAAALAHALDELTHLFGPHLRQTFLHGRLAAWAHDPWSRGAYSYTPVGAGAARDQLATPIADTLFLAGEATVTNGHVATVHGAIESGRRAAQAVLQRCFSS